MDIFNKIYHQINQQAFIVIKKPLLSENEQRLNSEYDGVNWVPVFFTVRLSESWLQKKQCCAAPEKQIKQAIYRLFKKHDLSIYKGIISLEIGRESRGMSKYKKSLLIYKYTYKNSDLLLNQTKNTFHFKDIQKLRTQITNPHLHGYILLQNEPGCLAALNDALEELDAPILLNKALPIKHGMNAEAKRIIKQVRDREAIKANIGRKVDLRVGYQLKNKRTNHLLKYMKKQTKKSVFEFCNSMVLKK